MIKFGKIHGTFRFVSSGVYSWFICSRMAVEVKLMKEGEGLKECYKFFPHDTAQPSADENWFFNLCVASPALVKCIHQCDHFLLCKVNHGACTHIHTRTHMILKTVYLYLPRKWKVSGVGDTRRWAIESLSIFPQPKKRRHYMCMSSFS